MSKELAQSVYNHLAKTNQAFCFVDGEVIDRQYIAKILGCSIRELRKNDISISEWKI